MLNYSVRNLFKGTLYYNENIKRKVIEFRDS